MMEYLNISLLCFSETDEHTTNFSISYLRLMFEHAKPPFLVMFLLALSLNILSISIILNCVSKPSCCCGKVIGEGPIHLVLRAISDIFASSSPWIVCPNHSSWPKNVPRVYPKKSLNHSRSSMNVHKSSPDYPRTSQYHPRQPLKRRQITPLHSRTLPNHQSNFFGVFCKKNCHVFQN